MNYEGTCYPADIEKYDYADEFETICLPCEKVITPEIWVTAYYKGDEFCPPYEELRIFCNDCGNEDQLYRVDKENNQLIEFIPTEHELNTL